MPTVAGPIVPGGSSYPGVDQSYFGGGWRSVANITARNAIPSGRRVEGMRVYAMTEGKEYQLIGGIADANWTFVPQIKDTVAAGTEAPDGVVTGYTVGQIYSQTSGGALLRLWVFTGTPGTSTGWV